MTGFGKGICERDGRKITINLRSVNHRFLDLTSKFPRNLIFCEDVIRKTCSAHISRGHIDIFCSYEDSRQGKGCISADIGTAVRYMEIGSELEKCGFVNDLTASQVLRMPDVIVSSSDEGEEEIITEMAVTACLEAITKLKEMRQFEGNALKSDIKNRLNNLAVIVAEIEKRAPLISTVYAEKLRQRIEQSLSGVEIDEARLLNEVAFFVDKSNVDEEIVRLKGHIKHAESMLEERGTVGKKLDFIVQELNREINTTGSKSNDLALTEMVLSAKNEIEKIREQVQNIE